MGAYTQIIEFSGLPACGKSTLCAYAKQHLLQCDRKIALWYDVTKDYKQSSLLCKIKAFPFSMLPLYTVMFFLLPRSTARWYVYWFSIKISIIYSYIKIYSDYDHVFIDHGVLQNILSLLRDKHKIGRVRTGWLYKCIDILCKNEAPDLYVICKLKFAIAIERMVQRNRLSEGRLDKIRDVNLLESYFLCEESNLHILSDAITNDRKFIIDTSSNIDMIYQELLQRVQIDEKNNFKINK